jgi:uncharacterized protein YxeA
MKRILAGIAALGAGVGGYLWWKKGSNVAADNALNASLDYASVDKAMQSLMYADEQTLPKEKYLATNTRGVYVVTYMTANKADLINTAKTLTDLGYVQTGTAFTVKSGAMKV